MALNPECVPLLREADIQKKRNASQAKNTRYILGKFTKKVTG